MSFQIVLMFLHVNLDMPYLLTYRTSIPKENRNVDAE